MSELSIRYNLISTRPGECDWLFHWQYKLCTTFSGNVNINYRLPIKVYYHKKQGPSLASIFVMCPCLTIFIISCILNWQILFMCLCLRTFVMCPCLTMFASYPFGIISLAHAPVNVTDFSIGSINCVRHFPET
jgi:hypothetical protein